MQFSTDLPHGKKGIASGKLPMNVSKEADQSFMVELRRTDPSRYARLEKAIRTGAIQASKAQPVAQAAARCSHCNLILPSDSRSKYCDSTCSRDHRRKAA